MLRIKKISISGLRGILSPQELNLTQGNKPGSLVLYGLNSTGKTSFVDGIEWFLSPSNEIEWLKRENAGCNSYPHLEAKKGECFVSIQFSDEKNRTGTLIKTFDHNRITIPKLSDAAGFNKIYSSFIIRPYFRYLEIIDFVFNRTGVEKYKTLANWMGFEDELNFQEKIALDIFQDLKNNEKQLTFSIQSIEKSLNTLIESGEIIESNKIAAYCNNVLAKYHSKTFKTMKEYANIIDDIENLKIPSVKNQKIANITRIELGIDTITLNFNLKSTIESLGTQLERFSEKKELTEKIDYIVLYQRAADILDKEHEVTTRCPLCGNSWKKTELIKHIKDELALLESVKTEQDSISIAVKNIKIYIASEITKVAKLKELYEELITFIPSIDYSSTVNYLDKLNELNKSLDESIFILDCKDFLQENYYELLESEKKKIKELVLNEKNTIQPSKEELTRNVDIEKVKKIIELWNDYQEKNNELNFFKLEVAKFNKIVVKLSNTIQENVTYRFQSISSVIQKYFGILRDDKDIKDIEITLNQEKIKAAGRSAEIKLSYYNISVKPAYKVLSESLLNSLGLAVYFACIKHFNHESKFIVLDDIMNSLDVDHRDTLLDLIEQEFSDYQIILFTHDLHWFARIQRRFPNWIHKKIKNWSYGDGPKIDSANTTKEEIAELLEDDSKAHDAGNKMGIYIESILNELCESLHAELRYRYTKNDPPSMDELFSALHKRLQEKLSNHDIVSKVNNAKKYEPLLRNSTAHPRENYSSTISPKEVKRAMEEWLKVENELFCKVCNKYVEYFKDRGTIECKGGHMKLVRTN